MARRPLHGVAAHHPGDPDGRMRRLVGARPGVHVAVLVMVSFPAEGSLARPGVDDEVVGFLEPLPVVGRGGVVGDAFAARAADPAGDQAPAGNHVDGGQVLGQPQRVVPDGQDVPEQHDLRALRDAGEDRGLEVHHLAHAERRRVVLVQHEPVEPHLLGVELLVEVAVVEVRAEPRVVGRVGHAEVGDVPAGGPEVPGTRILVRTLGEVADEHAISLRSCQGARNCGRAPRSARLCAPLPRSRRDGRRPR